MDELFESFTLIQTHKIAEFPVVLMGTAYWRDLLELLDGMVAAKTIDKTDLDYLLVTDSVDEAMAHIRRFAVEKFGLRRAEPRRSRILWER
jgi:predicted Rossmann-fold nucleotide-binding protein